MTRNEFEAAHGTLRRALRAVRPELRRAHHQMATRALDLARSFVNSNPDFAVANLRIAQHHAQHVVA